MKRTDIDIEALKSRHDLSAIVGRRVKLRRAGHELVGLRPFHKENTPSFRVNDTKGAYNCFGCGAHGDVLDFIMEAEGLHFMSAVRWLEGSADLTAADPAARERNERIEREARAAAIVKAQAQWRAARSDCVFNQATLHPADPIKCHTEHAENAGTQRHHPLRTEQPDLDPLENSLGRF